MLYRLYTPDDFAPLYAIEEVCFQPPFRFGRKYMRKLIDSPNAATWIAEEDGRMAGFALVEWTQETGGIIAYIQTIEVAPDRRGRGIGGELLRRVEDSARAVSAQGIWLHVEAKNAAAIGLYEAHGYENEGREEDYYSLGRAALIYGKTLELGRPVKASSLFL
jgi:ribosomal protein S18 acetylase RimI-like enzyme